ncbi:PAS domain S-box protein [Terasakiella sp. A23]|uniref:hybrid sensor histidine kinase/response regulator n=1 Tax=Terasakiella sp. FCG-A23 TaxID=3080561 RepID=UPI002953955B|nr:PAS domain S-box protein [Terasakiella sp. A23]MDV7340736.1 PAS domain S-box protein [Terasakiella sp. A23]
MSVHRHESNAGGKSPLGEDMSKLQAILEKGPAILYHCQSYWEFDFISPNVTDLLGWSQQDLMDRAFFMGEIVHPDDVERVRLEIPKLFETDQHVLEYRLRTKAGDYIWIRDEVRHIVGVEECSEGFVGQISDNAKRKAAALSLTESELKYRAIFETVLEGVITIDWRGIIQDVNHAAVEIFGYSPEEIIGKNVSVLMPKPYAQEHDGYLANYHKTHRTKVIGVGRSVSGKRKNGEVFDMHLSVSELDLPTGKCFVGCVRDTSMRTQAEQALRTSQERLRMSQQVGKIGTWDWHLVDDVLYWSDQVPPLLGLAVNQSEVRGERLVDWVHPDDLARVKAAVHDCIKNGTEFKQEHRVRWPDGTVRWVLEHGNIIQDDAGQPVRMIGVILDMTETKTREDELRVARENADQANKAKSEFLSKMSHELRTPLNAILGFAQLLGISRKHALSDRQQTQVDQIVQAGHHLLELINEILDLSRIEAGRLNLNLENISLQSVVDDCLPLVETLAREQKVHLNCEGDMEVQLCVDRTRLKQVLLNLLSNAIKYNKEDGHVWLDVRRKGQGVIRISVRDDGIGIGEEYQDELFKPFHRLGAEVGDVEGTGVGLTLTKQLVEIMGGIIDFESQQGHGSRFWIELHVADGAVEEPMIAENFALKEQKKLLYLNDHSDNVDMMSQLVRMVDGVELVLKKEWLNWKAVLEEIEPDVLVLDVRMDRLDNLSVVQSIKEDEKYKKIPILGVSSETDQGVVMKAEEAGVDECFIKPLNLSSFVEKLKAL